MSKLSKEEILKIAKLAKLQLTDEEVLKYQNQLSSVLEYVTQVQQIEPVKSEIRNPNVESNPKSEIINKATEDKPKKSMDREELLKNAPMQKAGLFKVPQVFK